MLRSLLGFLIVLFSCTLPVYAGWSEGVAAFQTKDFAAAAFEFQAMVNQSPDSFQGHYMLGRSLEKLAHYEKAQKHLRRAHELRPDDLAVRLALGSSYLQAGRVKDAVQILRNVNPIEIPDRQKTAYYLLRAEARLKSGDSAGAMRDGEALIRIAPDDARAQSLYARTAFIGNDLETAAQSFEKATRLEPEDWRSHLYLAQTYSQLERYAEAETSLDRALELAPGEKAKQQILQHQGFVYEKRNQYTDAVKAYQAVGDRGAVARVHDQQRALQKEAEALERELRVLEASEVSRPMPMLLPGVGDEEAEAELPYVEHVVFYATDRAYDEGGADDKDFFGEQRSPDAALNLGACRVSIPRDRDEGIVNRPWRILGFGPEADPARHFKILNLERLSEGVFYGRLSTRVRNADSSEGQALLVFVHGYNVSFNEAIRRTAQLAVDLPFEGVPVTYSWPSYDSLPSYVKDGNNAYWSVPHLERFLLGLIDRSGAATIHLIAHSMGNRVLTAALRLLAVRRPEAQKVFGQIVLAAPDIDAATFEELAAEFGSLGQRATLYASSKDGALQAAHKMHGYPRAGDTEQSLVVIPGLDTIDATEVDTSFLGHSYYGDNVSVLRDLVQLLKGYEPEDPSRRIWLAKKVQNGKPFWQVRLSDE